MVIPSEAKQAAAHKMIYWGRVAPSPNCLVITSTSTCLGPVSSIDEDTIANDQRVPRAGVSQEEARLFVE